ncbi:MAG: hypothetical protein SO013_04005 [Prevotella sp.]|nr:hypothetical protein [Prevotella sp.]
MHNTLIICLLSFHQLQPKEKNDIRKEVVVLQDILKDKDRKLEQQQKELKAYEEERSFIQRFMPPFFAPSMFAESWRL